MRWYLCFWNTSDWSEMREEASYRKLNKRRSYSTNTNRQSSLSRTINCQFNVKAKVLIRKTDIFNRFQDHRRIFELILMNILYPIRCKIIFYWHTFSWNISGLTLIWPKSSTDTWKSMWILKYIIVRVIFSSTWHTVQENYHVRKKKRARQCRI